MHLAVDLYVDLIEMPPPVPKALHPANPLAPDIGGEQRPEPVPPQPDRFMADVDTALEQAEILIVLVDHDAFKAVPLAERALAVPETTIAAPSPPSCRREACLRRSRTQTPVVLLLGRRIRVGPGSEGMLSSVSIPLLVRAG